MFGHSEQYPRNGHELLYESSRPILVDNAFFAHMFADSTLTKKEEALVRHALFEYQQRIDLEQKCWYADIFIQMLERELAFWDSVMFRGYRPPCARPGQSTNVGRYMMDVLKASIAGAYSVKREWDEKVREEHRLQEQWEENEKKRKAKLVPE